MDIKPQVHITPEQKKHEIMTDDAKIKALKVTKTALMVYLIQIVLELVTLIFVFELKADIIGFLIAYALFIFFLAKRVPLAFILLMAYNLSLIATVIATIISVHSLTSTLVLVPVGILISGLTYVYGKGRDAAIELKEDAKLNRPIFHIKTEIALYGWTEKLVLLVHKTVTIPIVIAVLILYYPLTYILNFIVSQVNNLLFQIFPWVTVNSPIFLLGLYLWVAIPVLVNRYSYKVIKPPYHIFFFIVLIFLVEPIRTMFRINENYNEFLDNWTNGIAIFSIICILVSFAKIFYTEIKKSVNNVQPTGENTGYKEVKGNS